MRIPREVPVMTLPDATLFPCALLPLYIFEPRYQRMLADALKTNRMFSVALRQPGRKRETPSVIAGLGLIRVAIGHEDGTSHLVLQGLARIELAEAVRYRPYRVQRIKALQAPPCDNARVDALVLKVRELVRKRVELGLPLPPLPVMSQGRPGSEPTLSTQKILSYLDSLPEPDQMADVVSCAFLPWAADRQEILETIDVEARLNRLVRFLIAETRGPRKNSGA